MAVLPTSHADQTPSRAENQTFRYAASGRFALSHRRHDPRTSRSHLMMMHMDLVSRRCFRWSKPAPPITRGDGRCSAATQPAGPRYLV
jgi:hypothetical protein